MSYYRGDYYQGDYYQGDLFKKIGKGLKRLGKNIGKVAKAVAPVAGVIFPAVGAATLVGRAYAVSKRVQSARDAIKRTVAQPAYGMSPSALASAVTGQMVGIPSALPTENGVPMRTTSAPRRRRKRTVRRKAHARRAYARRRITSRSRRRRTRR